MIVNFLKNIKLPITEYQALKYIGKFFDFVFGIKSCRIAVIPDGDVEPQLHFVTKVSSLDYELTTRLGDAKLYKNRGKALEDLQLCKELYYSNLNVRIFYLATGETETLVDACRKDWEGCDE